MRILVVDVGGTNVKILATGQTEPRKIPSGPDVTPEVMTAKVLQAAADWPFDAVTVGYPGPVIHGRILKDPRNLGPGWMGYDFAGRFGKPTKLINDAAMQALGSYQGGRMLFLGLGTGLGSAMVLDHLIAPLELAHLPYQEGKTFEDYVGQRGHDLIGKKAWRRAVFDVVGRLKAALLADYVVLGGGNSKKLKELPEGARLGSNENAFIGGYRLWDEGVRE